MVRTRNKRYSGGPEQQEPDRNRLDDLPVNDHSNENGQQSQTLISAAQPDSNHTQTMSQPGLPGEDASVSIPTTSKNRQQWTREQYADIMWCYYYAMANKTDEGVTKSTYSIWRERNPDIFPTINPNTLANQRRFILREKKLTNIELEQIKTEVNYRLGRMTTFTPTKMGIWGKCNHETEAARDTIIKHDKKTNWIYCSTLILDPRHKAETFDLTVWGTELKVQTLKTFELIFDVYCSQDRVIESFTKEKIDSTSSDDDDEHIDFNHFYPAPGTSSGSGISGSGSQNQRKAIGDYLSQPSQQ
ncbi:unnamed protein product [Psylliodes chrysocephalus]|uniref:Uncharacterized protein n=1 Tax=Psylliodes chrysocephalus TaxID=3402493 RepID=A0A9P0GJZ0_9CUCU|nr:unnamed protein product [Psylliodes chrysocephala]